MRYGREDFREIERRRIQDQWPGAVFNLPCPECGSLLKIKWSTKFNRPFYGCARWPECKGTHGAHPDGKPLGIPASEEVKKARMEAHEVFDTLWSGEDSVMSRKLAYRVMGQRMGFGDSLHISKLTAEGCRELILMVRACREVGGGFEALVRFVRGAL